MYPPVERRVMGILLPLKAFSLLYVCVLCVIAGITGGTEPPSSSSAASDSSSPADGKFTMNSCTRQQDVSLSCAELVKGMNRCIVGFVLLLLPLNSCGIWQFFHRWNSPGITGFPGGAWRFGRRRRLFLPATVSDGGANKHARVS